MKKSEKRDIIELVHRLFHARPSCLKFGLLFLLFRFSAFKFSFNLKTIL